MKKKVKFSVPLALIDYINPIMYAITAIILILNINQITQSRLDIFLFNFGVFTSILFGLFIPTMKLLVGLGKIKFELPVNLVTYVNSGLFLSGLVLIKNILHLSDFILVLIVLISIILLGLVYKKTKKFNNIAILIGALGYLLIYVSLITKSLNFNLVVPIIFYCIAILFYLFLIVLGMRSNLKDAKVHWILEISNIICQSSVAIGTIILFI